METPTEVNKDEFLADFVAKLNIDGKWVEIAQAKPGTKKWTRATYFSTVTVADLQGFLDRRLNVAFLAGIKPKEDVPLNVEVNRCTKDAGALEKQIISLDLDLKDVAPNIVRASAVNKWELAKKAYWQKIHAGLTELTGGVYAGSHSGNGIHSHLYTKTPLKFESKEEYSEFYLALVDRVEQHLFEGRKRFDRQCANAARLMRLPFSTNWKNANVPVATAVIHHDPNADAGDLLHAILNEVRQRRTAKPSVHESPHVAQVVEPDSLSDHKERLRSALTFRNILSHCNYSKLSSIKEHSEGFYASSPWKQDSEPSCNFNEVQGYFKDFCTDHKGDKFKLIALLNDLDTRNDFAKVIEVAEKITGIKRPEGSFKRLAKKHLPRVYLTNRHPMEFIEDAWKVLKQYNEPERKLFRRSGRVAGLKRSEDGAQITQIDDPTLYGHLLRAATWGSENDEGVWVHSRPPKDVVHDMLIFVDEHLPQLRAVVRTPLFGRDKQIIHMHGFHEKDALYFDDPQGTWANLRVSSEPTRAEVEAAKKLIMDEMLGDFAFAGESEKTHYLAAMLLPFVRPMFLGKTPLHLIEAPIHGSGKTLLADLIYLIVMGTTAKVNTLPNYEAEVRKLITSELLQGLPILLFDNAQSQKTTENPSTTINSPALAAAITADEWSDRVLGGNEMARCSNDVLWLMTGNNLTFTGELARRVLRIRLAPPCDKPWERTDFTIPDLPNWVRDNRTKLVGALLTLVRNWIAAGCPLSKKRLGSFEQWARTMGGILEAAEIGGFLEAKIDSDESTDEETDDWKKLIQLWLERYTADGGEYATLPLKSGMLNQLCASDDLLFDLRGYGGDKSQETNLGNALRKMRDRVIDGYKFVCAKDTKTHGRYYALVKVDATEGSAGVSSPKNDEGYPKGYHAKSSEDSGTLSETDNLANLDNLYSSPHSIAVTTCGTSSDDAPIGERRSEVSKVIKVSVTEPTPETSEAFCGVPLQDNLGSPGKGYHESVNNVVKLDTHRNDASSGHRRDADVKLIEAVRRGDLRAVKALLDEGADPNGYKGSSTPDRETPICFAIRSGRLPMVQLLVEAGASWSGFHLYADNPWEDLSSEVMRWLDDQSAMAIADLL